MGSSRAFRNYAAIVRQYATRWAKVVLLRLRFCRGCDLSAGLLSAVSVEISLTVFGAVEMWRGAGPPGWNHAIKFVKHAIFVFFQLCNNTGAISRHPKLGRGD